MISVVFAPKRVSHPNIILFKEKVTNLEPEISPYYTEKCFTPIDTSSRPHLQPKLTRLSQLHSDYSQLTTRRSRIHYLKRLLQEKDVHKPADQESDSEGSSEENLGDVTQFGLTGALAQMANLTFMTGAPEVIQNAERLAAHRISNSGATESTTDDGKRSKDGAEARDETSQAPQISVQDSDSDGNNQEDLDEAEIMAAAMSRGRRTAVVVPSSSQKPKKSGTADKSGGAKTPFPW